MCWTMNANTLDTVGARLRWLRDSLGLSAREVDRLAGLHSGHTWVIERAEICRAQVNTLEAIANALRVDPAWLVFGAGSAPNIDLVRIALREAAKAVQAVA